MNSRLVAILLLSLVIGGGVLVGVALKGLYAQSALAKEQHEEIEFLLKKSSFPVKLGGIEGLSSDRVAQLKELHNRGELALSTGDHKVSCAIVWTYIGVVLGVSVWGWRKRRCT